MNNKIGIVFFSCLIFYADAAFTAPVCPNGQMISETFPAGSKWELCWEQRDKEGIVLRDLFFTTPAGLERKVLREASLAHVHVAFDDGSRRVYHIAEHGLGGPNLQDLGSTQCPNGDRIVMGSKHVLCKRILPRGYLYKYYSNQKQAHLLEIYSQSNTAEATWVVRWQLYDDGTIEPGIGATAELGVFSADPAFGSEVDDPEVIAAASVMNYFWRLDFDIAGNGNNDLVEELNVHPASNGSEKELAITSLGTETARRVDEQLKRSWRIRDNVVTNSDGHPISYHLEPLYTGFQYTGRSDETWADNEFYVTRNDACERFVANNPTDNGCASGVTGFVNGQNTNGADIVIWYGMTDHHSPRDEDLPYKPTRWTSFQIIARDWTATSPLVYHQPRIDGLQLASLSIPAPWVLLLNH